MTIDHFRIIRSGLELTYNWGLGGKSFQMQIELISFLMMFFRMSLHCKLVSVTYREYECGLIDVFAFRFAFRCKWTW